MARIARGTRFGPPAWVMLAAVLVFLIEAWLPAIASAQPRPTAAPSETTPQASTLPDTLSEESVRALLARLSDDQVRELLLQELDRMVADQEVDRGGFLMRVDAGVTALRASVLAMLAEVPRLPEVPGFYFSRMIPPGASAWILPVIALALALVFALGFAAEWGFRRLVRPIRRNVERATPRSAYARLGWLLLRIALDAMGLVVFALGSIAAFLVLYHGHGPVRITAAILLDTILVVRTIILLSRFVLAPHAGHLRLFRIPQEDAQLLHRELRLVAIAGGILIPIDDLLGALGLDPALTKLVGSLTGWTFIAIMIAAIWRARAPVARLIRGASAEDAAEGSSPTERVRALLASAWHIPMTAYVIAIALGVEVSAALGASELAYPAIASFVLVVAIPVLGAMLISVSDQFWSDRMAPDDPAAANYTRLSRRCLQMLMVLLALVLFGEIWGVSVFEVAGSGLAGQVLDAVVDIGMILLLAYVSWEVVKTMIDRRLAGEDELPQADQDAGGEGGGPGASRLRTLLPLLRSFLFGTIVVMAVMIILSSLGVNIGPLIAGAGVVGLAIGFGAQTLVRDIVSGVFFLVDDAFRLGEYIEVGTTRGAVEKISIRSLRLRHHRGPLHTIPFGEITQLTNHSRDWVIMKLEFRVPYDTDLSRVKKIFKQIGAELQADPTIGPNLLQPFKSQGVLQVDDSALVVRGKFTAKPGEQFLIRREVFQRVQQKFEENGIQFARRQVSVYVPPMPGGGAPPAGVAEAAAAAAAQQALEEQADAQQQDGAR